MLIMEMFPGRRAWLKQTLQRLAFPVLRRWRSWCGPGPERGGVPRGVFREKTELEQGRVEGGVMADGQMLPALREGSEIVACGLGQAEFASWAALWTRRDSAHLVGSSWIHVDAAGRACYEAMYGQQAYGDPVWNPRGGEKAQEFAGDWTSLGSRWNRGTNYYHWITDGLTRLIYLPFFPAETGILVPSGMAAFAQDSLKLLGLWERVRVTEGRHLEIENYWFAGPMVLSGCANPLGMKWLRDVYGLPSEGGSGHRKIFVSRRGTKRDLTNMNDIERVLAAEGWDVLEPGELSFREQIETFRDARVIVGLHGAGMTNLLWAPIGVRVLELMPRTFRNGCYEAISLVLGHRHEVLLCPADSRGNLILTSDLLQRVLAWGQEG
ncbi:MAG: glycosyltransferase 61 family protein [Verrucomicrobia bacterium]|nr:glycosyltransferase 61 family protein [Verrucomicrobiota bacterium]